MYRVFICRSLSEPNRTAIAIVDTGDDELFDVPDCISTLLEDPEIVETFTLQYDLMVGEYAGMVWTRDDGDLSSTIVIDRELLLNYGYDLNKFADFEREALLEHIRENGMGLDFTTYLWNKWSKYRYLPSAVDWQLRLNRNVLYSLGCEHAASIVDEFDSSHSPLIRKWRRSGAPMQFANPAIGFIAYLTNTEPVLLASILYNKGWLTVDFDGTLVTKKVVSDE